MKPLHNFNRIFGLAMVALFCTGCSRSSSIDRPDVFPVAGVVILNGKPLADATVVFQPQEHEFAAMGKTDSEGRFQLTTFDSNDGAVPGSYRVSVVKHEEVPFVQGQRDDAPSVGPPKLLVPSNYADPTNSGLTATVVSGQPNEVKLELTGQVRGARSP
ncbi:carboxypeptidase-like regulatory domain-containing protein [Planctomicrobium sp. SH664]|uniref:carboxypeptidase-like regulatory domain-containing protein n=1 Tax=Planctomicrobium sp. SH664 TaxID=3448125 RepID=UPI003F5AFFC8